MDLLVSVVHRGRKIGSDAPSLPINAGYGYYRAWLGMYLAVVELSSFQEVGVNTAAGPSSHGAVYKIKCPRKLATLIRQIREHDPAFRPAGEDRPQVRRRQVATALLDVAHPTLPFD